MIPSTGLHRTMTRAGCRADGALGTAPASDQAHRGVRSAASVLLHEEVALTLVDWLRSLSPDFAFLLALPFFDAAVGLLGYLVRRRRKRLRREGDIGP